MKRDKLPKKNNDSIDNKMNIVEESKDKDKG
jgi:hypothetical protein